MSDLKGFSLRKKGGRRVGPKDSARDAPPLPDDRSRHALREKGGTTGNSTDLRVASRSRTRPGGATSDIVKKRYSVRYAQVPDFGQSDAPRMPGVPNIPQAYAQHVEREPSPEQRSRAADMGVLQDPSMQTEEGGSPFHSRV